MAGFFSVLLTVRLWPVPTVAVAGLNGGLRCYPVIRLNHSGMMLETERHLARDGRSGVPDLDDSSILRPVIQVIRQPTAKHRNLKHTFDRLAGPFYWLLHIHRSPGR